MLSNLASYIFGSSSSRSEETSQTSAKAAEGAKDDEWVIVGGDDKPLLTLGSLNEAAPRPSFSSTGSSEMSSVEDLDNSPDDNDVGEVEQPTPLVKTARRLVSCANGLSLTQTKALRLSQKVKHKESGKHLTAKSTERHNKAVKAGGHHHSNKKNKSANLSIRSCGINKQLKQC